MGKWVAIFIPLLHFCLSGKNVLAGDEGDFFSNFLLEEPIEEAQCDRMQLEFATLDSSMTLDRHPKLNGKWVSQECEVRPGPEFLLRSYFFTRNNSFRLVQHFYEDESCILPLYSVVARGEVTVKEPSWVTPGGTECEYSLSRVTVIPHTTEATEKLSNEMKRNCPDRTNKIWKPHREYIIYSLKDSHGSSYIHRKRRKYGRYKRRKIHRDVDCLSALGIDFNELMLIRTQTRIEEENKKNKELLLGDIHSRKEARFIYKPTAFQVPLLKSDQAYDCDNCQIVSKSTERAPPHLQSKPQLPPLPHGQWVSQRCEVRPFGIFLIRKLSFDSRDRTWNGEYKFYADPFCRESLFSISVSGTYVLGPIQRKEKLIRKRKTGAHFDFHIEDASLTLHHSVLRDTFTETDCGVGSWYVGVPKELSPTSGCSVLGIVLPTVEYELIKLEIDNKGTPLLFMGQPDTENKKRSHKERPTSYQAPLAQCSVFPQQTISNHLEPVFYARTAPRSTASRQCHLCLFLCNLSLFIILSLLKNIVV